MIVVMQPDIFLLLRRLFCAKLPDANFDLRYRRLRACNVRLAVEAGRQNFIRQFSLYELALKENYLPSINFEWTQ